MSLKPSLSWHSFTIPQDEDLTKNNLEARIVGWEQTQQSKPTPKTRHHKPGSQKK